MLQAALDAGVADFLDSRTKRKEQEEERKNFEEAQRELKEQKEADGEEFIPEKKEWPDIQTQAYKTQKVQFVVGLNTLGQDREFNDDEVKFALRKA